MELNQPQKPDPMISKIYFSKYKIVKKLGEGSFGWIYLAEFRDEKYALKFENRNKNQNLLENEAYVMNYLKGPGIPFVKSFGFSGDYNILVMEWLGKSLEDIFNDLTSKKMSVNCVCNLGYQMIVILKYIHDKHIIHRDIKPDNFVLGVDKMEKYIYWLDFGWAKKYRSSTTLVHYSMTNKKKLTGTARYASVNALRGLEQSRRDDWEAVGYVLMYFLKGLLPWQGLKVKINEDKYAKIMEKKRDTTPKELCEGFPKEFEDYISYTRGLGYEQDPDYDYWTKWFITVLERNGTELNYIYDWTKTSNCGVSESTDATKNKHQPWITTITKDIVNANVERLNENDQHEDYNHIQSKRLNSEIIETNIFKKNEEINAYATTNRAVQNHFTNTGNISNSHINHIVNSQRKEDNQHEIIKTNSNKVQNKEYNKCCIIF